MQPPWSVLPSIPAGSIGWRMGAGEEYYDAFYRWFSSLSPTEQSDYALKYPVPDDWTDLYQTIKEGPWV
jgi:hypothetical protein